MEGETKIICILAALLISLLISFGAKPINAQEVEEEREFDYGEKSEKGPRKWGELKKEWEACSHGKLQSPIDMSHARVGIISRTDRRDYKASRAIVRNRGHDIQIEWFGDAGSIFIGGTEYPLRHAHWHSPSEHTVNGIRYDLELHLVHQTTENGKNKTAVLSVLYRIGKPDEFLSKLTTNISSMIDRKDEERALGRVDPNDIKIRSKRYYRYLGSLTVPPCTEGVIWTINKKVKTVSHQQVELLREAVHDYAEKNSRPLQAKNKRDIFLYGPDNTH